MVAVDRKSLVEDNDVCDLSQALLRYLAVHKFGIDRKTLADHRREQSTNP